jgi:hypothetical protein
MHPLDAWLVINSSELDRLCGYAVSVLEKRAASDILDLLTELEPERICAISYAFPRRRRMQLLRCVGALRGAL